MPNKKITIEDLANEMMANTPKATKLGEMALEKYKRTKLPKEKKSNIPQVVQELKALKKELAPDLISLKSSNPLDRNEKEIVEKAIYELCIHLRKETEYNANWLNDFILNNLQAGRKIHHDYETRIRGCQLIHYLIGKGMNKRQARATADTIYGINETDSKRTYAHFLTNLKKYYFPEIKNKEYAGILLFSDIIAYGRPFAATKRKKSAAKRTIKSQNEFENFFQDIIQFFKNEIKYTQENNFEELGIPIEPLIIEILNSDYKTAHELILKMQTDRDRFRRQEKPTASHVKNAQAARLFVYHARQFIYALDLYDSVK